MEERLRKFAQVVDNGGFSKAAQQLHISQPALTAAVKKLERELGATLLERRHNTLVLTPAGQKAYESAKALDAQIHNLKQSIAEANGLKPVVRLGMIDSIADLLTDMPDGLSKLSQLTDLSVTIDNSSRLLQALRHDTLDIALVVGGPQALTDNLEVTLLGNEPLVLVTDPADAPRSNATILSGRLPKLLSYNVTSHTHHFIVAALAEQGVVAEPTFYSTSPEVILKMALSKQGVAILPYAMVSPYISRGNLARISSDNLKLNRPIYAVQLANRQLPEILMSATQAISRRLQGFEQDAASYAAKLR